MAQRTFSFSAKPHDTASVKLVEDFQIRTIQTGISFSRLVLDALRAHKERLDSPAEDGT